ncbi:hypothetical protein EDB81DRAFT_760523 [Dactylonectria macrodidyma]|uniref:Uncharacterized protein n=1 Tax=Dactylonectria macrodidyma TaxID=307937 RepID=A0A9P9ER25_9HYPO|nr:hypothetical protein EDB81DRAFT_760523 [Dactylonectria macrodidyma]
MANSFPQMQLRERRGSQRQLLHLLDLYCAGKVQATGTLDHDDMQNRLGRLEDLNVTLMQGDANVEPGLAAAASVLASTGTPNRTLQSDKVGQATTQDDEVNGHFDGVFANSLGVLKIDLHKGKLSTLANSTGIPSCRKSQRPRANYFSDHKKELQNSYEKIKMSKLASAREGVIFHLGSVPPATEVELRAELPPRSAVLALCHRYFNFMNNPVLILHSQTLHQKLEVH